MSEAPKRSSLKTIFFTNLLDMLAFALVVPVFGFLFEEPALGGDGGVFAAKYTAKELKFLYLLMIGSYSVGTWLGAPVIGALSDKFGRKRMLQFTYSANALFLLVFVTGVLLVNYPIVYVGRILAGLTGGSLLVINAAIADVSAPEDKAKNFGITGIAFGIGSILGTVMGGLLSDPGIHPLFNESIPIFLAIGIVLINLGFLTFCFRDTFDGISTRAISIFTGPKNLVKAVSIKSLRDIFIVIFFMTLSFNFLIQFYQFYLRETFGFSKTQVGLMFGFIGISIAFVQGVILRYVSNRFQPKPVMAVGLFVFAISYLLLLIPASWPGFAAATFMIALCQGITFPTSLSMVSNLAEKDIQGETIGINMSVQSFAAASPILIVFFMEIQYDYPMYLGAMLTGVAWLYFMWSFYRK